MKSDNTKCYWGGYGATGSLIHWLGRQNGTATLENSLHFGKVKHTLTITSWQIEGENVEVVIEFLFLGSKITADDDCSHEIGRHLLLGRKAMTNPDSVLKSRDITLPTKVHIVKAMVFPVVTYSCESWIVKKAEHPKIDAFEQWC